MQPSLRLHATLHATELARVGENRHELVNPTVDSGGCLYPFQKQPPNPTIKPRSAVVGRHPGPTRICRARISARCLSRSLGALYMRPVRITTFPSAIAGQQLMATHLRPTNIKQVMFAKMRYMIFMAMLKRKRKTVKRDMSF
jgi:hypothetical protein